MSRVYNFKPEEAKLDCTTFIWRWFFENPVRKNALIDLVPQTHAALAAKLCVDALGQDHVIGVINYGEGVSPGYEEFGKSIVNLLGIQSIEIQKGEIAEQMIVPALTACGYDSDGDVVGTDFFLKIYDTLITLVAFSKDAEVINTSTLSEYIIRKPFQYGYCCPFHELTETELREITEFLGFIPDTNIKGWDYNPMAYGKDEETWFTYEELDRYIRGDVDAVSFATAKSIQEVAKENAGKVPDASKFTPRLRTLYDITE